MVGQSSIGRQMLHINCIQYNLHYHYWKIQIKCQPNCIVTNSITHTEPVSSGLLVWLPA